MHRPRIIGTLAVTSDRHVRGYCGVHPAGLRLTVVDELFLHVFARYVYLLRVCAQHMQPRGIDREGDVD